MEQYETKDIRNIVFVGHGASGKTSLVEAVLYAADATKRSGSIDEGTTVSDFDTEEKERSFSIDASLLHYHWQGREVNVIDTPGYPDFVQGVISSLSVVETAMIVVSAQSGIQVNTQKAWNMAGDAGLARVIIITNMDGESTDFPTLLNSLKETFGQECLPLVLPVGCGTAFKGVVNLLSPPDQVPGDVIGDMDDSREKLVEGIVSVCDEQLERYL
ncbi:MAG: GTP-binding protein, partial [Planctomycetes bacterium]|nr:GTP-binding protein [Planctomycetota bacterium]